MKSSHILIVDDSKTNIQVLAKVLDENGYHLSIAEDGEKALKILEKIEPDLILLDVMMPVMDGYETIQEIKKNPQWKDIPVIFLTAKSEKEEIAQGLSYGAVDYITKPFYESELLMRVATHLDLKHSHDTITTISQERKQLIHILCHDLLNPVGQIETIIDLDNEVPGTLNEMKEHIKTASANAVEIINLVRKMTSLEDNKYKPEIESCSLEELVHESLLIIEPRAKQKDIPIRLDLSAGVRVAVEKTSFINTVFNNILTNAIKFSYAKDPIDIQVKQEGDEVVCQVIDYGVGMSPELARDIFDLKKNSSRPGTEKEKGTGYGMPLVKRFIESYGGSLEVKSVAEDVGVKDHGTTMILRLKKA